MGLPDDLLSDPLVFDEQFHIVNVHGEPVSNTPFRVTGSNGQIWVGTTDAEGLTPRIEAPEGVDFTVEVLESSVQQVIE